MDPVRPLSLTILLVDSFYDGNAFTFATFQRAMAMPTFTRTIGNTLKVGDALVKLTDYNPTNKRIYQVGESCCPVFDPGSVHIL